VIKMMRVEFEHAILKRFEEKQELMPDEGF
jgi:hypothetical protein